ncbi:MAG: hypothetical protein ACHQFW_08650 [Chitinophagales bacterium]
MNKIIIPKKENANKGFNYTVSDEQIEAYAKFTLKEKLNWLEKTNEFIYRFQTEEEKLRMREMRNKEN